MRYFWVPRPLPRPKLYLCLPTRPQKRNWRCIVSILHTKATGTPPSLISIVDKARFCGQTRVWLGLACQGVRFASLEYSGPLFAFFLYTVFLQIQAVHPDAVQPVQKSNPSSSLPPLPVKVFNVFYFSVFASIPVSFFASKSRMFKTPQKLLRGLWF